MSNNNKLKNDSNIYSYYICGNSKSILNLNNIIYYQSYREIMIQIVQFDEIINLKNI